MPPLRILFLEDDDNDAQLVERELRRAELDCELRRTDSAEGFARGLAAYAPDLILSDFRIPGFGGLEALALAHTGRPATPVIIVTGSLDEETAAECIKAGASDYVLKDNLARLLPAIDRALALARSRREREQAEASLRSSEERYRAFIAMSSEAIWRLELEEPCPVSLAEEAQVEHLLYRGIVAECNDALARMFGAPQAAAVIGARLADVLPPDDDQYRHLLRLFVRARYRVEDLEMRRRDERGDERILTNTLSGVVEDGRLLRAWGIVRDATERHRLEAQLHQAQKMEAVGRLAGGVAHDFNNILTAITGYCDLALSDIPVGDDRRMDLEEIRHAADRAAALTRQLLAFSRQQVLQPRVFDLNEIVTGLERLLGRLIGEDVRLSTRLSPRPLPVRADPGQLEQVIMNLVVNARDAMPAGGRLTIESRDTVLDDQYIAQHPVVTPGRYVLLSVTDTGVGMDPETRARIFEPFFTTKGRGQGTGLGLATAYGIVKQSGGFIWVYSEPGRGTTFKVYLPLETSAPTAHEWSPALTMDLAGTETVLVAEDEDRVRALARTALKRYGYVVLEAPDGERALDIVADHRGPLHVLVTDLVMPGMSGRELAQRLVATRPGLRVVFMSGYTDDTVVRHGMLDATSAYLQKPFHLDALVQKVREVLDGTPASGDGDAGRRA